MRVINEKLLMKPTSLTVLIESKQHPYISVKTCFKIIVYVGTFFVCLLQNF